MDNLKKDAYDRFDSLIDDHVMTNKCPVPIYMDADVGPSYKSSATHGKKFAHFTAYQGCRTFYLCAYPANMQYTVVP